MADNCIIGPVSIADPYLVSDVEPLDKEGKEFFKVRCTKPQARQLLGLVSHFTEKTVNGRKVYNITGGYGVVPIDASTNISDGLIRPRGLYIIEDVLTDLRPASPNSVVGLSVRKLSDDFTGYLDMDYTTGYNDGTSLASTYPPSVKSNKFTDEFTSFDTTNVWYSVISSGLTGSSITASGGDLVLAGAASTDASRGAQLTTSRTAPYPPFTMEFGLEWVAAASSGRYHEVSVMLTPSKPASTSVSSCDGIWLRLVSMAGTTHLNVTEYISGVGSIKYGTTLTSAQKTPTLTWSVDAAGKMTIKLDKAGGTSYTTILNGYSPSTSFVNGYYVLSYLFTNNSSTTASMKSERIEVYNYTDLQGLNVVSLPVSSTPITTQTTSRAAEDGNIPLYVNPTGDLKYSISQANFYKGSVKAWNSNYADDVSRLVTSIWDVLKVGDFYLTNGLVKLVPIATGVEFYYWDGSAYVLLNTFTTGTITNIKPLYVSPERFTLQVNDTEWTLFRGKPFVFVYHPYTALGYTKQTEYYHDAIMGHGLVADADVTMLTQPYGLIFNPYNLLTLNQYGFEDGDYDGWEVQSGATLSMVSPGMSGSYALRVQTPGSSSGEGAQQITFSDLLSGNNVGLPMVTSVGVKGTGTVVIQFHERDSAGTSIANSISTPLTLTSSYQYISHEHTITDPDTEKVSIKVLTNSTQTADYNMDNITISPSPSEGVGLWGASPLATNNVGMMVMKQDPTTIKSDSIPASNMTGIGVYEQLRSPISLNHFYNLFRESTIRTLQQIGVK